MRYTHRDNLPVYAPNSYGGPRANPDRYSDPSWLVEAGELVREAYALHSEDDDYTQAGMLYRNAMTPTDRDHLVDNIVFHMGGVEPVVLERSVNHWRKVDLDLGTRLAAGVGLGTRGAAVAAD
jgi:catalase